MALEKECLEILTFSVKGIKTKQNKKKTVHNPQSLAREVKDIKAVKMRLARQKWRKGLAVENTRSLTDFWIDTKKDLLKKDALHCFCFVKVGIKAENEEFIGLLIKLQWTSLYKIFFYHNVPPF